MDLRSAASLTARQVDARASDDILLVDGDGFLRNYDVITSAWFPVFTTLGEVDGLWRTSDKLFVFGDRFGVDLIATADSADGPWSAAAPPALDVNHGVHIAAMSGRSKDEVFAVGAHYTLGDPTVASGSVFTWVTDAWQDISPPSAAPLAAAWTAANTDLFAVATDGAVHRWDGSTWSSEQVTNGTSRAIWGTSNDDIYVVGAGLMAHFDGSTWSPVDVDPALLRDFTGISGSGATDVFVVSAEGTVLHYDGLRWSPVNVPGGRSFSTVSATPEVAFFGTTNGPPYALVRVEPW
jgi:hypothetical protein